MKWLDKKWIAATATAALLLTAAPALAAADPVPSSQAAPVLQDEHGHWAGDHGKGHHGDHEQYRMKRLKEAAEYFGISTEGKSAEQLRTELKAAREKDKAKWERFKAERKAEHMARLQKKAKELGISTEGKSMKQLHKEIHQACKDKQKDGKSGTVSPSDSRSQKTE